MKVWKKIEVAELQKDYDNNLPFHVDKPKIRKKDVHYKMNIVEMKVYTKAYDSFEYFVTEVLDFVPTATQDSIISRLDEGETNIQIINSGGRVGLSLINTYYVMWQCIFKENFNTLFLCHSFDNREQQLKTFLNEYAKLPFFIQKGIEQKENTLLFDDDTTINFKTIDEIETRSSRNGGVYDFLEVGNLEHILSSIVGHIEEDDIKEKIIIIMSDFLLGILKESDNSYLGIIDGQIPYKKYMKYIRYFINKLQLSEYIV